MDGCGSAGPLGCKVSQSTTPYRPDTSREHVIGYDVSTAPTQWLSFTKSGTNQQTAWYRSQVTVHYVNNSMSAQSDVQPTTVRIGHRTTFDDARRTNTITTVSKVGKKRTFEEVSPRIDSPSRTGGVLSDITNQLQKNDFIRQSVINPPKRLEASDIVDCSSFRQPPSSVHGYTQRKKLALAPTNASNPLLSLSHPSYNLPVRLVQNFASLGIHSIYPWQSECLLDGQLLRGDGNLVYTAPTGGGKSLIADVLMLKKVIEHPHLKAILVLPYVALVQEKLRWLRKVVDGVRTSRQVPQQPSIWRKKGDEDSIRVVGFMGGSRSKASWQEVDIAVCTIEKVRKRTPREIFQIH